MFRKPILLGAAALLGAWALWQFSSGTRNQAGVKALLANGKGNHPGASLDASRSFSRSMAAEALDEDGPLARTRAELEEAKERIAELEATVSELADAWNRFAEDEETKRVKASMRGWGPEQAIGPPDSPGAGDHPTAWATLAADGGIEWLQADYAKAVEIAQVRILENDNPGAVVKITAQLENGAETVLWQGVEPRTAAPADQLFAIPPGHIAASIRIYLDTGKVPGWNEIDAVELIGRDGSRQWARGASASSTYAARGQSLTNSGNFFPLDTFSHGKRGLNSTLEFGVRR